MKRFGVLWDLIMMLESSGTLTKRLRNEISSFIFSEINESYILRPIPVYYFLPLGIRKLALWDRKAKPKINLILNLFRWSFKNGKSKHRDAILSKYVQSWKNWAHSGRGAQCGSIGLKLWTEIEFKFDFHVTRDPSVFIEYQELRSRTRNRRSLQRWPWTR